MANKSDIGRVLSRGSADVERGRLRFFAKATGETRPVYTKVAAARDAGYPDLPAPPTFLFCMNSEVGSFEEELTTLQLDLGRVLHAEQAFDYHRMAFAGDTLSFETRVCGVYDKKGGALHFVEQITRVENQRGEHVADLRLTIVERRG
ncbi:MULTISPECIES: MaoC family dehydratase N-terminal domain-containing protein [unclassified Paraburkholderia]|uniref:MaoC family dehydratase N-terminal domain-containing protein n=1 Tax=unclassified Paraburkholderia TaxID=2615204 RepID=UPI002AB6FAA5|nr:MULTISPECIES: MaoC family dehydratase N-terminal domain-containing protein [unclassified Paraburkholderia]